VLALRLIHHMVDWDGATAGVEHLVKVDQRLQEECLWYPDPNGRILRPRGESVVFGIALAHYRQTGQRIPLQQLNAELRNLLPSKPDLYGQANSVVAGARAHPSNGSDVDAIINGILDEYKQLKLNEIIFQGAVASQNEDPAVVRQRLLDDLEGMVPSQVEEQGLVRPINDQASLQARIDDLHSGARRQRAAAEFKTGFDTFDHHTNGLRRSQLVLVCGQSKKGKSAFCTTILLNIMLEAEARGERVDGLWACKEWETEWKQDRIEALFAWKFMPECYFPQPGANGRYALSDKIHRGVLDKEEIDAYYKGLQTMAAMKSRILIASPSSYTNIDDLDRIIARKQREGPLGIVWVDALQRQKLPRYGHFVQRQDQAIEEVIGRLEDIATRRQVCVVCEVQEKTEHSTRRYVELGELVASSTHSVFAASHVLRFVAAPNHDSLGEIQMVGSRFSASGWSFPLYFWAGDMFAREGGPSENEMLKGLWAMAGKDRRFG
jgi:hypothetical protein